MTKRVNLIVGLGNKIHPGTRHSVGMAFVEDMAKRLSFSPWQRDKACLAHIALSPTKPNLVLMQPSTLMNLNGQSVVKTCRKYDVASPRHVFLVHDDVETPLGKWTLRFAGGARGHNGIRSCVASLQSKDVHMVRLGVGRPHNNNDAEGLAEWVLQKFTPKELQVLKEERVFEDIMDAILKQIEMEENEGENEGESKMQTKAKTKSKSKTKQPQQRLPSASGRKEELKEADKPDEEMMR
ncbi:peptidyl-tRNA hydrolase protein 1 [Balamuthia mandrillaris]